MKRHSLGVIPFRPDRRPRLSLPLSWTSKSRAAQISVFPEFESARPFSRDKWSELPGFKPGILIGYGFDLRRLADKVIKEELDLTTVDHAVFALTDCGLNPISDGLRETLWHIFKVPVYELIVAPGCRLLAAECEAHDGWHLQPGADAYLVNGELVYDVPPATNLHTGFTGDIETEPCPCGRSTVRLKNLGPCLPQPFERRVAAVA
jgi:hypothetical protein